MSTEASKWGLPLYSECTVDGNRNELQLDCVAGSLELRLSFLPELVRSKLESWTSYWSFATLATILMIWLIIMLGILETTLLWHHILLAVVSLLFLIANNRRAHLSVIVQVLIRTILSARSP